MTGSVYVMNLTGQDLNLSTNGMGIAAGTLPGWNQSGNKYQTPPKAVPRVLNASDSPGKFFNGTNSVMLNWSDGLFFASIRIDGNYSPLTQDLILVLTRNSWQLVNQYAAKIASGDVNAMSMLHDAAEMAKTQAS